MTKDKPSSTEKPVKIKENIDKGKENIKPTGDSTVKKKAVDKQEIAEQAKVIVKNFLSSNSIKLLSKKEF